jgi:thioredoxin reductase
VAKTDGGFTVTAGDEHTADYLILATGPDHDLAESLGLSKQGKGIPVDRDGKTSVDKLYVVGWAGRPDKIQAIISAGDGAAAALDILSREAGKDLHDFDSV